MELLEEEEDGLSSFARLAPCESLNKENNSSSSSDAASKSTYLRRHAPSPDVVSSCKKFKSSAPTEDASSSSTLFPSCSSLSSHPVSPTEPPIPTELPLGHVLFPSSEPNREFTSHLNVGIVLFNRKPEHGITYWRTKEVLTSDDPKELGAFLFHLVQQKSSKSPSPTLSQRKLASFIGKKTNVQVAVTFFQQMEFVDQNPIDAFLQASEQLCITGEAQEILQVLHVLAYVYIGQNVQRPIFHVCYPNIAAHILEEVLPSVLQDPASVHLLPLDLATLFYSALVFHREIWDLHHPSSTGGPRSQPQGRVLTPECFCDYIHRCDTLLSEMVILHTYTVLRTRQLVSRPDHTNSLKALSESLLPSDEAARLKKWGLPRPLLTDDRFICLSVDALELKPGEKRSSSKSHIRKVFLLNDYLVVVKPLSPRQLDTKYRLKMVFPLDDMNAMALHHPLYPPNSFHLVNASTFPTARQTTRPRIPRVDQVYLQFKDTNQEDFEFFLSHIRSCKVLLRMVREAVAV